MVFQEQTTCYCSDVGIILVQKDDETKTRITTAHTLEQLFPTAILSHAKQGAMLRETIKIIGCCTRHLRLVQQTATDCPLLKDMTISKPQHIWATIHEVGKYGKKGDSAGNYACKINSLF